MLPQLPFFPEPDGGASSNQAPLVGIARLAQMGEAISEGHNVEYLTLPARSLLNRCSSPRMPFTWTINPYRGCEFACKYCYARYTHEFMELRDGLEFERKIYVKQQARELLRRDLRRVKPGEDIAIGTATDPYQPAERKFEVTRAIMEELAQHRGLDIGLVTKSQLVLRDIGLLKKIAEKNHLHVNVTVTTVDVQVARLLEPRAPRPDIRLDAVRKLNQAGVAASVMCAPVLPGITDSPGQLNALVKAAAEAGAQSVAANPLFLKPCSAKIFLPFIEEHFPELKESYRKRFGERAFVSMAYRKQLSALMSKLKQKHGMGGRKRPPESAVQVPAEEQMQLFG